MHEMMLRAVQATLRACVCVACTASLKLRLQSFCQQGRQPSTMAAPEDPLAQTFDLLVLGTGLQECLLAAAAARAGQRVLHLDSFDYYGGESAAFPLHLLPDVAKQHAAHSSPTGDKRLDALGAVMNCSGPTAGRSVPWLGTTEAAPAIDASNACVASDAGSGDCLPGPDLSRQWPIRYHGVAGVPEHLRSAARRVTVDLLPNLTLCRGGTIDALVDSGVANYMEFVVLQACYCVHTSSRGGGVNPTLQPQQWDVYKVGAP
jgi:RAB protein geranylgeranyltransferase component A